MKIILAGSGDEVTSLIEALLLKKIEITVVDSSASFIDKVTSFYDVNGIVGDHLSKAALLKAGIERCDLFIGMTPSNSRNILCSSFAKSLGSRYSLARTKNFEQASDIDYIKQTYNIDYIIDADFEEAIEIAR